MKQPGEKNSAASEQQPSPAPQLLQSCLESPADLSIFAIDKEYRYLYFNQTHRIAMHHGYEKDIMVGMNMLECIGSEEERNNARINFDRALFGESHSFIQEFGAAKRSLYQTSHNPLRNDHGRIIGIAVFAHDVTAQKRTEAAQMENELKNRSSIDITERKKTEEALRHSESQLSNALKMGRMGHWEMDVASDTFTFSDSFYAIFRTTAAEAGGYRMASAEYAKRFVHPDDAFMVEEETRKALAAEDPHFSRYLEHRMLYADGSVGYIAVRFFIVKDDKGKTVKTYGVNQDISEIKRMEEELQKSQKLESLGLLAGGIAHDFNNLLGGIYGYIEIASESARDKTVERNLAKALSTIDRARGLTQQLLTFAKGGAPIKKLDTLIPFIEETVKFALSGSNVSPRFAVAGDLWSCEFDKSQIGQVIDNIVINALQAMPEGGLLEISAANAVICERDHGALPAGNYVKIAVRDHGIGMPKEILPKIFDPFFTTKAKGHGLGLATCYSIIVRHDGCIEVESEPGKGSTFTILLPAAAGSAPGFGDQSARRHEGKGIFVVMDDEEVMRDVIGDMLESFGYSVVLKENGREAVDFFKRERENVTAMIFDLTIPGGMGGKEAIGEIRRICPHTPVFVVSGYAEDPVMSDPAHYGFTASICKPFKKTQLADMLNRYVRKGK